MDYVSSQEGRIQGGIGLSSWPAPFQLSERDIEENNEQYMDLACSASGSCPAEFAKGELHPALSLDSEPSRLEAAPRSGIGMSEPSNKRLSAAERNRQAQKRFRQRQKV